MANYNLQYVCEYDSLQSVPCKIEIYGLDFSGNVLTLKGGAQPALLSCQTDEPNAPIKGLSLQVQLLNTGNIPLTAFYSIRDDQFLIKHIVNGVTEFVGYIVQDDCIEEITETDHIITLSANDNLGLLRDVTLLQAYSPGLNENQTTVESLEGLRTLQDIIRHILLSTGLSLQYAVYCKDLLETNQSETQSFLSQTYINPETWLSDNGVWENCYTILEQLLGRFNLTLFQAEGRWNLVRWPELQLYSNAIPGYLYDATNDTAVGTLTLNSVFNIGSEADTIQGATQSIVRPIKSDKETFNYRQPKNLLRNYDLLKLGTLITQYMDVDGNTIREYNFPDWTDSPLAPQVGTGFIRVVTNSFGTEIDRYAVIAGDALQSTLIEANEGDKIRFSFRFRTETSLPIPATFVFLVRLTNGTTNYYVDEVDGRWLTTFGFSFQITSGSTTDWTQVTIESAEMPVSGNLYCYLTPNIAGSNLRSYYKDIRFEYIPYINDSTKIIGQTHFNLQTPAIKNVADKEIYLDDSPRNYNRGTLFLATSTGLLRDRTLAWYKQFGGMERLSYRLGYITTYERLFIKNIPRMQVEGSHNGGVVNMLSVLTMSRFTGRYYIFGRLEIDYKNDTFTGTIYEQYKDGDLDAMNNYEFNYIYENG